ncbi:hypothetical protein APHAL10511_001501 [Amanita phalloides]|nr:hypothetical protein APHAL10511_001501 [Amanita phalloides]
MSALSVSLICVDYVLRRLHTLSYVLSLFIIAIKHVAYTSHRKPYVSVVRWMTVERVLSSKPASALNTITCSTFQRKARRSHIWDEIDTITDVLPQCAVAIQSASSFTQDFDVWASTPYASYPRFADW